jgi:hypothetical protein
MNGETMNIYKILIGKPEKMKPLGKPSSKTKENIRKSLKEIVWVWIGLIWLRVKASGGLF